MDDKTFRLPVRIPASYDILEANEPWWPTNLMLFPQLQACKAYKQERIPFIPYPIRTLLITRFCRESLQAPIRASKKNEDCLIRVYTGKRHTPDRSSMFFNLRNYGLCVDQMEDLGLDIAGIVKVLAEALVHCYWKVGVDANDLEFVSASLPNEPASRHGSQPVFHLLDTELVVWMLDYDCVRDMSQDEDGVAQAVHAYFPRPYAFGQTSGDWELWEGFKECFLVCSRRVLEGRGATKEEYGLPGRWAVRVEAEGERRANLVPSKLSEDDGRVT
jgi:hypothetical protein